MSGGAVVPNRSARPPGALVVISGMITAGMAHHWDPLIVQVMACVPRIPKRPPACACLGLHLQGLPAASAELPAMPNGPRPHQMRSAQGRPENARAADNQDTQATGNDGITLQIFHQCGKH